MTSKYTDAQKEHQWDDRMEPTKKSAAKPFLPDKDEVSHRPTKDDIRHAYSLHNNGVNSTPGFASVAAAFDFEHHVGSDPALELQVLKSILVREGNLSQIEALVQLIMKPEAFPGDTPNYNNLCSSIIELLAKTRNQTVLIIEQIEKWREQQSPRVPFVWQNTNYLLKICRDLDYLSQVTPLVELLGVPSESMRHNPLMLENSLDELPVAPEVEDSSEVNAMKVAEKTRLRQAEAVLQREEKFQEDSQTNEEAEGGGSSDHVSSRVNSEQMRQTQQEAFQDQQAYEEEALSILNWYDQAQLQLQRLREPMGPSAIQKSTGRMQIPKPDKLEPINTTMSQQRESILGESKRLTDFLSTSPVPENRKQQSKRGNAKLKALNNPYRRAIEENSVGMRTKPASASLTSTQKGGSLGATAPVTAEEPPVAEKMAEETKYVVRPMTPSVRVPLSVVELEELLSLDQPSEAIAVVAASVLILLQPGNSVPTDVRWAAFKVLDPTTLQADLTDFEVSAVPKFKLRALRRFLSVDAFNPVSLAQNGSLAAAKLAVWVLRVIAAHPEGAAYIKEVRTALDSWDTAQREAAEKRATITKLPKKIKKKKSQKKLLEPLDRLLDDVRRSGEAVNKAVMAELKNAIRGTLPAACVRVMEAVSILLEPKRKGSIETVKALMAKATTRSEPTFESRIRDYGKNEAELVLGGPSHGAKRVQLLQAYVEDSDLETSALSFSSMSVSVLMSWVRSVVALVVFLFDEARQKEEEEAIKNQAATKLQSLERKNQAKKAVEKRREETEAAIKIQSRARVGLAKKSVERSKENAARAEEEEEAAIKIQGVTRRKQAKQRVDKIREQKISDSKKVAIVYDDQDAQRSAPKEIFAISNQQVENEEADEEEEDQDYDDEGYSEEEENEEDAVDEKEKEEKPEPNKEGDNIQNDKVEHKVAVEEEFNTAVNDNNDENNTGSEEQNTPINEDSNQNETQDVENDENDDYGEGGEAGESEVLSPLRSPPQTASRKELQTEESFGDTYGESDFEEFDDEE